MNTLTIVAMLAELVETHMEKCDGEIPHIVSEGRGNRANIDSIVNRDNLLFLDLDDGSQFTITVSKVA